MSTDGNLDVLAYEMLKDDLSTLKLIGTTSEIDNLYLLNDLAYDRMTSFVYPEIGDTQRWYTNDDIYIPKGSNGTLTMGHDIYFWIRKVERDLDLSRIPDGKFVKFSVATIQSKDNILWRRYQEFLEDDKLGNRRERYGYNNYGDRGEDEVAYSIQEKMDAIAKELYSDYRLNSDNSYAFYTFEY